MANIKFQASLDYMRLRRKVNRRWRKRKERGGVRPRPSDAGTG